MQLYLLWILMAGKLFTYCFLGTIVELTVSTYLRSSTSPEIHMHFLLTDRPSARFDSALQLASVASQTAAAVRDDDVAGTDADRSDGRNYAAELDYVCVGMFLKYVYLYRILTKSFRCRCRKRCIRWECSLSMVVTYKNCLRNGSQGCIKTAFIGRIACEVKLNKNR